MKLVIYPPVETTRLARISAEAGDLTVLNADDEGEALRNVVDKTQWF